MPDSGAIDLYYQTAREAVLAQDSYEKELSARAFHLLNLGFAMLAAGGIIVNFRLEGLQWEASFITAGVIALAGFTALFLFCISALGPRRWVDFPSLVQLKGMARSNDTDTLRQALADYYRRAAETNAKELRAKARILFWSVLALTAEVTGIVMVIFGVFWDNRTFLA